MPIVIGKFGMVHKGLEKRLVEFDTRGRINTI